MQGKVYLVRANPKDEGFLTIKGLEAITEADQILYDDSISDYLLEYSRIETELIYVGPREDENYRSQTEINQHLATKAQNGKVVTRLKGGDPFVFVRAGKEAKQLEAQNIDFEIISGANSSATVPSDSKKPIIFFTSGLEVAIIILLLYLLILVFF